jgi:hypothetical protein
VSRETVRGISGLATGGPSKSRQTASGVRKPIRLVRPDGVAKGAVAFDSLGDPGPVLDLLTVEILVLESIWASSQTSGAR